VPRIPIRGSFAGCCASVVKGEVEKPAASVPMNLAAQTVDHLVNEGEVQPSYSDESARDPRVCEFDLILLCGRGREDVLAHPLRGRGVESILGAKCVERVVRLLFVSH